MFLVEITAIYAQNSELSLSQFERITGSLHSMFSNKLFKKIVSNFEQLDEIRQIYGIFKQAVVHVKTANFRYLNS